MKPRLTATLVAAVLAAAAPATFAQEPGPAAGPGQHVGNRHHQERAFRNPTDRVEARLAYIRTALKITGEQQAHWDAYAAVLRKSAAAMEQRFKERHAEREKGGERKRPMLVERHERQRALMATAARHLDELIAAEKPLYAALSPEQQRVAEEVLAPRGRRGHGGFHRRATFRRS